MNFSPASAGATSEPPAVGAPKIPALVTVRRVVRDPDGNVVSDRSHSTLQDVPDSLRAALEQGSLNPEGTTDG